MSPFMCDRVTQDPGYHQIVSNFLEWRLTGASLPAAWSGLIYGSIDVTDKPSVACYRMLIIDEIACLPMKREKANGF